MGFNFALALQVFFVATLLAETETAGLRFVSSAGHRSNQAGFPRYACPFTKMEAAAAKQVYALLPKPLHMVESSGNATSDTANAQAIQHAGEKLEAEDFFEAQNLVREAERDAAKSQNDAVKARMLSSKAKADASKDLKTAQKDSEEAVALAKAALNASKTAMELSADAKELEATGSSEGKQMASAAKEWFDVANAEKSWKVKVVDESLLKKMVAKEDVLVIFYASWCPHCQTYVLHDAIGNSANTPAEALNEELSQIGGPQVLLFDVEAHEVPKGFDVQVIPTLYSATKDGKRSQYQGNPRDFNKIKQFLFPSRFNDLSKDVKKHNQTNQTLNLSDLLTAAPAHSK